MPHACADIPEGEMNNPRRDGGTLVPEKVKPLSGQEPPSLRGRSSLKRLRRQCVQGSGYRKWKG